MLKLRGAVKNYEWGKVGGDSEVARLVQNANPDFAIDNSTPYAELWFGTHPSGPSNIVEPESEVSSLKEWINKNPDCLGIENINMFGLRLSFILKVLSVEKPLSIQAHPDKVLAEKLRAEQPDIYKDANHKPEMAIALTHFEALCGFREVKEIVSYMQDIVELRNVVGLEAAADLENSQTKSDEAKNLKKCFRSLMTADEELWKTNLKSLVNKFLIQNQKEKAAKHLWQDVFLSIHAEFPDDIGCFGIYFFNYLRLNPGEAIFLGPNEPHAYLYGDCIECMACSDNVVRAGLTPKFKDIPTLCSMLTYKCGLPDERIFKGSQLDEHSTLFAPPISDFALLKIELPSSVPAYKLMSVALASVLLVVQGEATMIGISEEKQYEMQVTSGDAVFIAAEMIVEVLPLSDLLMFQAKSNILDFQSLDQS